MTNPVVLSEIKDSGKRVKLPLTHYERFTRMSKKNFGINVPEDLLHLTEMDGADLISDNTLDMFLTTNIPVAGTMMKHPSVHIQSEYYAMRAMYSHAMAFSRHKRVFQVEEGLTQKLLHTSIAKVDAMFVRSPFESLYLTLPYNKELLIPNILTGEHRVVGCYIYSKKVDGDLLYTRGEGRVPIKASDKFGSRDLHLLKIMAVGAPKEDLYGAGLDKDDALFYGMFMLKDGEDILSQIESQVRAHTLVDRDIPYFDALMSFIVNLLLYLSSPGAAMERVHAKYLMVDKKASEKEKAKAALKNAESSKISVISIGGGIGVLGGMSDHYRSTPMLDRVIGCPRWLVRGHWRAQAYGAGRSLRRATWIEPYEKGKGLGTDVLSDRGYKVS